MRKGLIWLICGLIMGVNTAMANDKLNQNNNMIVRISEIEVYPQYLTEYLEFAQEVATQSVAKEPGVVAIYPMMQIRNNNLIRILEIYRNNEAYQQHIASAHFQKYKQGTIQMVKSLDLVDMYQIAPTTFDLIFKKSSDMTRTPQGKLN